MTRRSIILLLAGAAATALIALVTAITPRGPVPWLEAQGLLLATYLLGLAIGGLVWKRRGRL